MPHIESDPARPRVFVGRPLSPAGDSITQERGIYFREHCSLRPGAPKDAPRMFGAFLLSGVSEIPFRLSPCSPSRAAPFAARPALPSRTFLEISRNSITRNSDNGRSERSNWPRLVLARRRQSDVFAQLKIIMSRRARFFAPGQVQSAAAVFPSSRPQLCLARPHTLRAKKGHARPSLPRRGRAIH